MNWLNKLRRKAWYWDVMCFIWCALLFILFIVLTVPEMNAQQSYNDGAKAYHYAPGVIGLTAMPAAFVTTNINKNKFTQQYGRVEPYMNSNKLSAYNKMMSDNNTVLITGAIVTIAGLVIQHFVSEKFAQKRHKRDYTCHF